MHIRAFRGTTQVGGGDLNLAHSFTEVAQQRVNGLLKRVIIYLADDGTGYTVSLVKRYGPATGVPLFTNAAPLTGGYVVLAEFSIPLLEDEYIRVATAGVTAETGGAAWAEIAMAEMR